MLWLLLWFVYFGCGDFLLTFFVWVWVIVCLVYCYCFAWCLGFWYLLFVLAGPSWLGGVLGVLFWLLWVYDVYLLFYLYLMLIVFVLLL